MQCFPTEIITAFEIHCFGFFEGIQHKAKLSHKKTKFLIKGHENFLEPSSLLQK